MQKFICALIITASSVLAHAQAPGRVDTVITPDASNKDLVEYKIRYPDGKTRSIGNLLNGKKEGIWRTYNNRNIIETIREYHDDKLSGISFRFTESGAVDLEENYKNDMLHGSRSTFLYNGVLKSIENYVNGRLDGELTLFYDGGRMQEKSNFKNGVRDGISTWYNQEEKPTIQYTYKMGVIEGPAKFYTNGILQSEGMFHNDNEEGEWKVYEDGSVLKTITYKAGTIIKETAAKKK